MQICPPHRWSRLLTPRTCPQSSACSHTSCHCPRATSILMSSLSNRCCLTMTGICPPHSLCRCLRTSNICQCHIPHSHTSCHCPRGTWVWRKGTLSNRCGLTMTGISPPHRWSRLLTARTCPRSSACSHTSCHCPRKTSILMSSLSNRCGPMRPGICPPHSLCRCLRT